MGRLEQFSNVLNYDDEAALLFGPSPLSGMSPSPLLPANAKRRSTARRHVLVKLMCSPFAAVFRTTCARASANEQQASTRDKHGEARRPSLEELLRMEASSDPELEATEPADMDPYDSWKESAIVVFDFAEDDMSRSEDEEDEAPLTISKDQNAVPGNEHQMAIVPVKFDVGQPAGLGGGAVPVNVERLVLLLAALGARSMALMGSYRSLVGRRAADKAEVFYHRPIPLGRRCRLQHLEESPYL